MQTYGQIYVLCVTTVRLICLFMRKLGLILLWYDILLYSCIVLNVGTIVSIYMYILYPAIKQRIRGTENFYRERLAS